VLAALFALAVWRPDRALVALALVVPFGSLAITLLDLAPVRLTEALVLAVLSGALLAPRKSEVGSLKSADYAALLFATIVVTSLVVVLGAREAGMPSPWMGLRSAAAFVTHDYLVALAPEFDGMASAALLLEGLGLLWIVRRHAREHAQWLLGALAAGAVGAAIVSFVQAVNASSGIATFLKARASGPVFDVNAVGSYFAMGACAAFAMAQRRATTMGRAMWGAVAAALVGGVWLSGSRMAQVAVIAGVAVLAGYARLPRSRQGRWIVAGAAFATAAALIALAVGLDPRPAASRTASQSVSARADFMLTGLRMIASAPAFGVGIGRYYAMSGRFMPSSIYWFYFHENAHNNFLQIAGELGVLGLVTFLWLLGAAAVRIVRALRAQPGAPLLVASAIGAAAFVATWLTSHPLLVAEVAYAFWIVLGVALGQADAVAGDEEPGPSNRSLRRATAIAAVLLLCSVPLRARSAAAVEPRSDLTFGFYDWENDNGLPYRWSSRRAAFFVPPQARRVDLPLRTMMTYAHYDPVRIDVAVNGRVLDTFLAKGDWTTVQLRLPPGARDFVRIDVITDPPWIPAETGASRDVRVLGVEIGRPEIY